MTKEVQHKDIVIPVLIRIGVTGHRSLKDQELMRLSIRNALAEIENLIESIEHRSPYAFLILSPLAEGADRLVAEEILKRPSKQDAFEPILEAILPFPEAKYMLDFETEKSKREFKGLLDLAKSVKVLGESNSPEDGYEKVGQYMVNICDLLIAIWDEGPAKGKGGTANVVNYALQRNRYVIFINSESGEIKDLSKQDVKDRFKDNLRTIFKQLEHYNNEPNGKNNPKLYEEMSSRLKDLANIAENPNISHDALTPLIGELMFHFVRADMLAGIYQKRYVKTGIIIYLLAGASVAIVPLQTFILQQYDFLLWLEVICISIVVILFITLEKSSWHEKWIEYRHLAERLRAEVFFTLSEEACNKNTVRRGQIPECAISEFRSSMSNPNFINNMTNLAISWAILSRPKSRIEVPAESLKNLLLNAWISNQELYYRSKYNEYKTKHIILNAAGLLLILSTLLAAFLHASRIGISTLNIPTQLLTFAAIVLPIAGTTVAGIRVYREYLLNAERYKNMADLLLEIESEMRYEKEKSGIIKLAKYARNIMLSEHDDWRVVTGFGKLNL